MSVSSPIASKSSSRRSPGNAWFRAGGSIRAGATPGAGLLDRVNTVATIQKNNIETIHVQVRDVDGASLIDIRIFRPNADTAGEPVPTENGVCVPRAKLGDLIDALVMAEAA